MAGRFKKIIMVLILFSILANAVIVEAKSNNEIIFKDKNLQNALCKYYKWNGNFTKTQAEKLSEKDTAVVIENSKITDLDGLQFFVYITNAFLTGNNLKNLKPLSKLDFLVNIELSNNTVKGKKLESMLSSMGKIKHLGDLTLDNNELSNLNYLKKIGNVKNYEYLNFQNNKISDISILKNMKNLYCLDLSNNRVKDVTPLKDLDKLTFYLDLRDNCIIDYKPIKHLFDKMYEDFDDENGMDRYDYYTNPVNFNFNGEKIEFPYLTVYYQYQAYAEAIPLLKAFGGSAEYNKKMGVLTCKYKDKELVMKDYSRMYKLNGQEKIMAYEMRRMQYDLAYVPVKDICDILGMEYKVNSTREFYQGGGEFKEAPELVDISEK